MVKESGVSYTDAYRVLNSGRISELLDHCDNDPLSSINGLRVVAGTRKSLFMQKFFQKSLSLENVRFLESKASFWQEDLVKDLYLMSGLSAVLKVGVLSGDLLEHSEARFASDVSTKLNGVQVHRAAGDKPIISKEELVEILRRDNVVGVKSQVAGLIWDEKKQIATGVVTSPSMRFDVSALQADTVVHYYDSLNIDQKRRAPMGILWPHPLISPSISMIDGVEKGSVGFKNSYFELLKHLVGVPSALTGLVYYLDKMLNEKSFNGLSMFGLPGFELSSVLQSGEELSGVWSELLRDDSGELLTLRNASPDDYEQMSALAIRNFTEAPNYAYLQTKEGRKYQQKYINANTPSGIADLCEKPNNLCNLVLEKDGEILGFRVVRRDGKLADGRRMHVSLDATGRGLGKLLLKRSEKMAKQSGCSEMEIHATGDSYSWFESMGFIDYGIRQNTISDFHLMKKSL